MNLLLVGFGTVGQGFAELLLEKKDSLSSKYGMEPRVVGISDVKKGSLADPAGIDLGKALEALNSGKSLSEASAGSPFKGDALKMIRDVKAEVMLEATYTDIKTAEPATSHIREAFLQGMHVITSNKGPVALNYGELSELAREKERQFLFEGTVMSGTPVLNFIRETLAGSRIVEIKGILNGTTNYILTRMEEGLSYEEALKKAQELGYAEAVPDADVLGWDALAKVSILANVAFDAKAKPFDYPCEGITGITAAAVVDAKNRGKRFKLFGKVWREGNSAKASVALEEVDLAHPLASVFGAMNAITLTMDTLGEVTVVGPGAGKRETGCALLGDLIFIRRSGGIR